MAKRIFAIILVLTTIFSCMSLPVSAATSGNRNTSYTLTVVTRASWWYPGGESITLAQTKGVFGYSKTDWLGRETGKTATKSAYGTWRISVRALDGTHSFSKTMSGGSVKLNLKANKRIGSPFVTTEQWIYSRPWNTANSTGINIPAGGYPEPGR